MVETVLALCLMFAEPSWQVDCIRHADSPPPPPPVVSVYRGMGTNVERWRPLVASYFPPNQVDRALCVMAAESGGNPDAKNSRSSARGLFQILASLWAPHYRVAYSDLYTPAVNVRIAADLHSTYGWWPWSPYKRGRCR